MIEATVCIIEDNGGFVLKDNIRGVSNRKTVFPGGKLENGESKEDCAIREIKTETNLDVGSLFYNGYCDSSFNDGTETWRVHIFTVKNFKGKLRSSEEGPVRWVSKDEVPFGNMWKDNRMWFRLAIDGKRFAATFIYNDKSGSEVVSSKIELINI